MRGVLTKTERDEVVTKGYFHDTLEEILQEKDYVTKEYLGEELTRRDYVNHETFNEAITMLVRMMESQLKEYKQHVSALHEHYIQVAHTISRG